MKQSLFSNSCSQSRVFTPDFKFYPSYSFPVIPGQGCCRLAVCSGRYRDSSLSLTQCFCFFSSSTSLLTLKHGGMCNQREERLGRKVLTIFRGFWKSLHHWELLIYNFLTWVTAFLLAGPSQCFAGLLGFWPYTSRSFS